MTDKEYVTQELLSDKELFRLASLIGCEPEDEYRHRLKLAGFVADLILEERLQGVCLMNEQTPKPFPKKEERIKGLVNLAYRFGESTWFIDEEDINVWRESHVDEVTEKIMKIVNLVAVKGDTQ